MADSTQSFQDKDTKAPNIFESANEKIEAVLHTERTLNNHKETHGMPNGIDENTPLSDVKAPNMFERAKEEIEALVETIHQKIESQTNEKRNQSSKAGSNQEKLDSLTEKEVKAPTLIERAMEEIEALIHHEKSPPHHHKETPGRSDDINENTPINEVKAPNVFQRAKEEVEALVETIHPKKEPTKFTSSSKKEGGFWSSIARILEKVCSPLATKRD
ncbi:uncharacterized protein LOC116113695 isoform X1 [Pistacia vera]|uniref:uncharacterized protein LOC116113695 isoform X1 n=1 Tax=Pistacia vera TaxID=55513 RepID=UPI001262FE0C|nr:uncharacterized protein LOC116113695 isoform X1 [Pistacia vera]